MQCSKCLLKANHPFGIFFDENGVCSGCNAFSKRQSTLPNWNSLQEQSPLSEKFIQQFGSLPKKVIVPFEADGETWYVLEVLRMHNIEPVVVSFNVQYSDEKNFEILAACQENFDCDFLGFSIPQELIKWCIAEELACGIGHGRKFEIFGRHISTLFAAEKLGINHIFSGPHQQSEVVGNHGHMVPNQLKLPAFLKLIVGGGLLPHVQQALFKNGSAFTKRFDTDFVGKMLKRTNWHYLSDYIFWDSERINQFYGDKYKIIPRKINGYSDCWQASSSDLKLEYFDLIRMMLTGHSKIESYLSRDIRFERINRKKAVEMLETYSEKHWDLSGFSNFMEINTETLIHGLELMHKSKKLKYFPKSYLKEDRKLPLSYHQHLYADEIIA